VQGGQLHRAFHFSKCSLDWPTLGLGLGKFSQVLTLNLKQKGALGPVPWTFLRLLLIVGPRMCLNHVGVQAGELSLKDNARCAHYTHFTSQLQTVNFNFLQQKVSLIFSPIPSPTPNNIDEILWAYYFPTTSHFHPRLIFSGKAPSLT